MRFLEVYLIYGFTVILAGCLFYVAFYMKRHKSKLLNKEKEREELDRRVQEFLKEVK